MTQICLVIIYLLVRKMSLNHHHGRGKLDCHQPYEELFVAFDLLSYISEEISVLPLECLTHKLMLFTEKHNLLKPHTVLT